MIYVILKDNFLPLGVCDNAMTAKSMLKKYSTLEYGDHVEVVKIPNYKNRHIFWDLESYTEDQEAIELAETPDEVMAEIAETAE